jgi:outer membrane lipopolysaccharide assembly protein LptE/RlpB
LSGQGGNSQCGSLKGHNIIRHRIYDTEHLGYTGKGRVPGFKTIPSQAFAGMKQLPANRLNRNNNEVIMRDKAWIFVPALVMMICGCGYHFTGGGDFPFQVKRIFVPVFENKTGETGIETVITNDFIYELTRNSKVSVVEKETADAVLWGVITSVSTQTISRSGTQTPLERRVRMFVDLKLTDRQGKVLWATRGFSDDESYEVLRDKFTTENNKRDAIKILSKRIAEMIQYHLTDIE